jgi:hypothetical protein
MNFLDHQAPARRRRPASPRLAALLLVVVAALGVSGCNWLGKGKEVADAYTALNAAKTGQFVIGIRTEAVDGFKAIEKSEGITITGAFDSTDPNKPKFRVSGTDGGETVQLVQPGDGKIYLTDGGETTSAKLPKQAKKPLAVNPIGTKIADALARSVVNFHDVEPLVGPDGQAVPAIGAQIGRVKLCRDATRSIAKTFNARVFTGELRKEKIRERDKKQLVRGCSKIFAAPPELTFGITAGALSDFNLNFIVRDGRERLRVIFTSHFSNLNEPQTGFDIPKTTPSGGFGAPPKVRGLLNRVEDLR